MVDAIGKLIDWIKSPRQSAIVFIVAVVLLTLRSSALAYLGLTSFGRYRGLVTLLAFLSAAALIVELATWLGKQFNEKRLARNLREERANYLHTLSPEEKGLLRSYLDTQRVTQYLLTTDGNVGALLRNRVLYTGARTGRLVRGGPTIAVNIEPWARKYLNEHPELLDGSQQPSMPPLTYR